MEKDIDRLNTGIGTIEDCHTAVKVAAEALVACTDLVEPALTYVASLIVGDQVSDGTVLRQFRAEIADQIGDPRDLVLPSHTTHVSKGVTSHVMR
jgi:hypothetical protein